MLKSPWIRKPDFSNIKHFDYDMFWSTDDAKLGAALKPRERIILNMIPAGSRVIDIGCGNSLLPAKLKEKGMHVGIADISPVALEMHRKEGIPGKIINLEDVASIDLGGPYDYIILSEVLEHTTNPEEIILALKKYTKYFILTIPNSAAYVFRYGLLVRGRFFTQWAHHPSEHLRFWSHIDFLDWLDAMGLEVVETKASDGFTFKGMLPFLPDLWKNFFGYRMVYLCKVR